MVYKIGEIGRDKHSSLFDLFFIDKEKKFYNIDTWSARLSARESRSTL